MRVAVYHDLPSGGAKRVVREQVRRLVARGHTVEVFLPATGDESFLPLAGHAHAVHTFALVAPPPRERALAGLPGPLDALRWLAFFRRLRAVNRAVADAIDAGAFDVLLVHPSQFTQAPYVLRYARTPTLYYCHEPLRAAYEAGVVAAPVRVLVRHTVGRADRTNVNAATRIAVNSRRSAERVRTIYRRSALVVYPGVDTDTFRPLGLEREPFALTVSALHPLKGIDFLVDALARIPAAERLPLVIVSDRARDAERRRLERRAAGGGVALEFRFRLTEEELVAAYNRARIVLYAPHDEPFGFVPLEAMACGAPLLAVSEGGILETVVDGENGFLAPRDAAAFAARLRALLATPAQLGDVSERAPSLVRARWSWDSSIGALERLCADIAGHDSASEVRA